MARKKKAPDANDLATMRLQAMQQAVQAGRQVSPTPVISPVSETPVVETPVPKPGDRTSSGIVGTEFLTNTQGQNVLVYGGSNTRVVPNQPAPARNPASGTILGFEYISGKTAENSAKRRARIADGVGGYTVGAWEDNPGYVVEPGEKLGAIPGPGGISETGTRTLAVDTFVNTLSLLIGRDEANKDYVKKLYALAAPYYRTGSTIDEAMNLALREAQLNNAIPEFTRRFRAIKALEDMRRQGIPVEVPTIAEFVKSQEALTDVLKIAGLKDLATEDFLNDVMSTGKSVRETTAIINDVFNAIDFAPEPVKAEIRRNLPFADRTTLAKAILTGERGVRELEQLRSRSEVKAAAAQAGLSLADAAAQELANSGFNFKTSAPRFGQVRQISQRGTFLAGLTGEAPVTQEQAIGAVFNQAANELETLGKIEERERLRFQGRSGAVKLASQARGSRGAF